MDDNKNVINITSHFVGIVAQTIAILACLVTAVLVLDRNTICKFYEIPTTYSSLDAISAIPLTVVLVLPGTIFPIILSLFSENPLKKEYSVGYAYDALVLFVKTIITKGPKNSSLELEKELDKEENDEDNDEHVENKRAKGIKKKISYAKALEEIFYRKYRNKKEAKSTFDLLQFAIYAVAICGLSFSIIDESILRGYGKFEELMEFLIITLIAVLYFFIILTGLFFVIHIYEEYHRYMKNKQEDSVIAVVGRPEYIRAKTIIFVLIVFWILSITVNNIEWVHLSTKRQYQMTEIITGDEVEKYVVVLDLEDYYVLEPIQEDGTKATISTERYLYKAKDNLVIRHRYYDDVDVKRYSSIMEEAYLKGGSYQTVE